mmetsp:Transcript_13620/g.20161  ORF Transcript_13620/g.20161 Transcript_13620/m.20161 type:complete len:196 (-) Transcript_13620:337-924(-)
MFGEQAFSDGAFTSPTYNDYLQYYAKCEKAVLDCELDDTMRSIAQDYITCVNTTKLIALDQIIENHKEDSAAYLKVVQRRGVIMSDEMKLLFLKREDFSEVKAAAQIMTYWEFKKLLFGEEEYHKDVTLDVIDTDRNRFVRLLPETDDSRRTIMVICVNELEKDGWTDNSIVRHLNASLDTSMSAVCPCESFSAP